MCAAIVRWTLRKEQPWEMAGPPGEVRRMAADVRAAPATMATPTRGSGNEDLPQKYIIELG